MCDLKDTPNSDSAKNKSSADINRKFISKKEGFLEYRTFCVYGFYLVKQISLKAPLY